ncbi:MAG: glycosyltransferase family 2 protein [Chloroflexota bacterium]
METLIDVVIPTRNRGDLIVETLESLLENKYTGMAIWVIDQSEGDGTRKAIKSFLQDRRVHYIKSDEKGSNIARNLGIFVGQAPIVAFTDDDCVVDSHWILETLRTFEDEKVDAVFGRVIDRSIGLPGETVTDGIKIAVKDDPERKVYFGNRFQLDFGHGACMAFRREILEHIDGFDPLLGNGGPLKSWPEKDIGYRILQNKGTIVYEPHVVVHHKQWRSWEGVKATQRNYGFGAGAIAARYLKNGDLGGLYLMIEWLLDQGARQVLSGIFKWRSWQKISAGLIQVIYPFPGFVMGLRYPSRQSSFSDEGYYFPSMARLTPELEK